MIKKAWTAGIISLLAASVLAGCGATSSANGSTGNTSGATTASAKSGTLTVGTYTTAETLDPALSHTALDLQIMQNIYGSLFQITPSGTIVPDMATNISVSSNGLTYVITLKKGIRFSDGTPFNAAAVKYNWERILNPATASPEASNLGPIQSITVNNPYQLTVTFKTAFAPFKDNLTGPVGMIASPTAIQKEGKSYGTHPVGAGPFIFKSWVPNGAITLVRNPHYFKAGEPKVSKVVFDPILSASTLVDALDNGQVQIADVLDPSQLSQVQSSTAHVAKVAGLGWFGMNINTTSGPLSNVHNRRAIQYAVNKAVIRKLVFDGTGAIANSQFSPSSWAYDASLKTPYSPSQAKKELQAAGNPSGFSFTVQAQNTNKYIQLTQILQSQLAKVGIHMKIQLLDTSTYLTNLNSGNYQADFVNMSGSLDPNSSTYIFDESSADVVKNGYNDPTVNRLLNAALATPHRAQRAQDYQQVAQLMNRDLPIVVFNNPAILMGVSNNVQGFTVYPTEYMYLGRVSVAQ
ncbi:ABC transporter substrate-binding protein [Sulfobacillus harzensis]|uniref:ABC transporter substrate-binding protein n=1 Tax=Sulfobacillus harzensis TaxID=2729629 RepID=A0A7Y0L419_9FIRM|nr:ABC transporter substrate-binding protein [Sulfobacillus harzensis]NMP22911.1 ABC transporter substrate-binding protein [Sulfobacillus harzensis]